MEYFYGIKFYRQEVQKHNTSEILITLLFPQKILQFVEVISGEASVLMNVNVRIIGNCAILLMVVAHVHQVRPF